MARVNTPPEFLSSGDFNADGHLDLVASSSADDKLSWLPGNGDGTFDDPRDLALPGFVSAMTVADVNRRDGLADVVVGIDADDPVLLVFEGPEGAFNREPDRLELDAPASAIVAAYLDEAARKTADRLVVQQLKHRAIEPLRRSLAAGQGDRRARNAMAARLAKLGAADQVDWVELAIADLKSTSCKTRKTAINRLLTERDERAVGPLIILADAKTCGSKNARAAAQSILKR